VVPDLFLILALRVENDLREEASEKVFPQLRREAKLGPVVTVFENIKDVA